MSPKKRVKVKKSYKDFATFPELFTGKKLKKSSERKTNGTSKESPQKDSSKNDSEKGASKDEQQIVGTIDPLSIAENQDRSRKGASRHKETCRHLGVVNEKRNLLLNVS